ncbi:MAG: arginine deiminase [Spirochaetales bacterium]|nr:arginine deiminase [Spirochaetales bacterium]
MFATITRAVHDYYIERNGTIDVNHRPFYDVRSEVGALEAVLLHRPGKELERLTPQYLEELLFDDIPWLVKVQEEHDQFAAALEGRGCRVYYYESLLEAILMEERVRNELITEVSAFTGIERLKERDAILEHLHAQSPAALAEILIAGLHKNEIAYKQENRSLAYYITDDYPFYINPLPNLYFTRDTGTVIGSGLAINAMKTTARRRETMILSYIDRYHSEFRGAAVRRWYDYRYADAIEGGDILVVSDTVLVVGCSARTSPEAIERLAETLFDNESSIREVLAIQIPFKREYMHLDTVFTMLDLDKFLIFKGVERETKVFSLRPGPAGQLKITPRESLKEALDDALGRDVRILPSGGEDTMTAAREQWNDGTNTLAVAPGTVVTYRRNQASNDTLRKNGVEVVEIEGSELVRGRGGPRCMSMPIRRAPVG